MILTTQPHSRTLKPENKDLFALAVDIRRLRKKKGGAIVFNILGPMVEKRIVLPSVCDRLKLIPPPLVAHAHTHTHTHMHVHL